MFVRANVSQGGTNQKLLLVFNDIESQLPLPLNFANLAQPFENQERPKFNLSSIAFGDYVSVVMQLREIGYQLIFDAKTMMVERKNHEHNVQA